MKNLIVATFEEDDEAQVVSGVISGKDSTWEFEFKGGEELADEYIAVIAAMDVLIVKIEELNEQG